MKRKTHISRILKQARLKLGYPQGEFAKLLGISQSRLCRYEKGNRMPPPQLVHELKRLLGGDVTDSLYQLAKKHSLL